MARTIALGRRRAHYRLHGLSDNGRVGDHATRISYSHRDTRTAAHLTALTEIAQSLALREHSGLIERETERVQNHPARSIASAEESFRTALGYQATLGRFRCGLRARR